MGISVQILGNVDCNFTLDDVINDFKIGGQPSQFASHLIVACLGKQALEPLRCMIKHTDANVRRWSAISLGLLEDNQTTEQLIEAAEYGEITVCKEAIRLMGQYRNTQVFEALIRILSSDTPQYKRKTVRQLVVEALGKHKNSRAVEPLISILKDPESIVRNSAVIALQEIGDKRSVEPLILALEDENVSVRFYAASALGNLGDIRALHPLIKISNIDNGKIDDGRTVKEVANKAIEQISKKHQ